MSKYRILLIGWLLGLLGLSGCEQNTPPPPTSKNLGIYLGITMVRPIQNLATMFERQHPGVRVRIKQGASGFLYNTLKVEKKGDLYFPGSDSYRKTHQKDGLFKNHAFVGYNRLALVVPKGNPKQLTDNPIQLTDSALSVVLASPESGAIGRNVKTLLDKIDLTEQVYRNVTYFTTDSHRITTAIKKGHADVAINWYATTLWPKNRQQLSGILLPESLAPKKKLELIRLSFGKHPDLANAFMQLAASQTGLDVFYRYGFFTEAEYQARTKTLMQTQKATP